MRARGTTLAPGDADAGAGTTARDAARTERGADIDECAAGRPPSAATVAEVQRCLGADIGVARPASCRRSEMHGLIRTMHSQATSNTNSAAAYRAVTASDAYSDVARRGGAGAIARAMRGSRLSEHNGPALQAVLHSLPKHGDAQPSLEHLHHAFYEEAKGTLCAFAVRVPHGRAEDGYVRADVGDGAARVSRGHASRATPSPARLGCGHATLAEGVYDGLTPRCPAPRSSACTSSSSASSRRSAPRGVRSAASARFLTWSGPGGRNMSPGTLGPTETQNASLNDAGSETALRPVREVKRLEMQEKRPLCTGRNSTAAQIDGARACGCDRIA